MRVKDVNEICEVNNNFNFNWKKTIIKPLIIGVSFGIGYYIANLYLKT
jgi:hypothetical protein